MVIRRLPAIVGIFGLIGLHYLHFTFHYNYVVKLSSGLYGLRLYPLSEDAFALSGHVFVSESSNDLPLHIDLPADQPTVEFVVFYHAFDAILLMLLLFGIRLSISF